MTPGRPRCDRGSTGSALADAPTFGHRPVAGYSGGQDPLVFLVADIDVLRDAGYPLVISDGHPVGWLSRCFTESTEIESAIDWPLMAEAYWNNTDADEDRERRRQAEWLP